jgi:hypothetical protein
MQLIETFDFLSLNFVHEKLTLDSTLAQKYSQKVRFTSLLKRKVYLHSLGASFTIE